MHVAIVNVECQPSIVIHLWHSNIPSTFTTIINLIDDKKTVKMVTFCEMN